MRQPSISPPSFYDDVAPPPLLTPPPNYDDLTPRIEVRDGYFDIDGSESNSDESTEPEMGINEPQDSPVEEEEEEEGEEEEEEETNDNGDDDDDDDDDNDDDELDEEDIVHMVGLEDLSLGVGNSNPLGRRSGHCYGAGIWSS